jgi:hypothetical protein
MPEIDDAEKEQDEENIEENQENPGKHSEEFRKPM